VHVLNALSLNGVCLDQLFEVLDQIWKLLNLDVPLDNVTWVQMANCFQILVKSLIQLFLFEVKVVSMFFADLSVDFLGEFGAKSDTLSLLEHAFLKERLNFDIVFRLYKLVDSRSSIFVFDLHVDGSVFCLDLDDLFVNDTEKNDFVVEVINLNSLLICSFSFDLNDVRLIELYHFLFTFQSKIIFVLRAMLRETLEMVLRIRLVLAFRIKHDMAVWRAVDGSCGQSVVQEFVTKRLWLISNGVSFVNAFVEQNAVWGHDVHRVLPFSLSYLLVLENK
jgi:hypothetical protein